MQASFASFTYSEQNPPSPGRVPTTLVVAVPLSQAGPLTAVAVWSAVRGATVYLDSPAMLTGVIA